MTDPQEAAEAAEAVERPTPLAWLAHAAPDPAACLRRWERDPRGTALLPAGRAWDVLVLPGLLGRATLEVLGKLVERPGPVLADAGRDRLGFLVPVGTAAQWAGGGVRCAGRGTWLVMPRPGETADGISWIVPPDGSGVLTDVAQLELALHEAAARRDEEGRSE
ncbi:MULTISPECIES: hypothetical protein [unclassified Streptomyces]|uniref:hypothetical protein n=1 Tax=unclassified Streptomyces TaxID=2593676 RepID=UPI00081DBCDA|nr:MULTISPECIES: hypothetical protein [unclassified Streptomyces]MYR29692.1 hypothetical protein [Streptomyces sp. SID4945]SCF47322.1 hypothetical protein GA0115257_118721 [Streptomyces sp. LcepLS]